MFNEKILDEEYKKYLSNKNVFQNIKNQKWSYYKENKQEINYLNEEYMKIDDRKKRDEFEKSHQILRTFYVLEFLAEKYKNEYKKYLYSDKPFDNNRKIVGITNKNDVVNILYDLDSKETKNISLYELSKIKYVLTGLKRNNSYICNIKESELKLMEVINKDIQNKYNGKEIKENICNEIKIDYLKALVFDDKNIKDNDVYKFNAFINLLNKEYSDQEISEKEYYIKYYYYQMLITHDPEQIYLSADKDKQDYVIEAYYLLSSYSEKNKEYRYHERTTSNLINNLVLKRKYKNLDN